MFSGCQRVRRAREFRGAEIRGQLGCGMYVGRSWPDYGIPDRCRHQSDDSLCRRPGPAPASRPDDITTHATGGIGTGDREKMISQISPKHLEGPTRAMRAEPVLRASDLAGYQELGSGARGTRTPDPVLAKHVLFQLSYSPARRAPRVPAAEARSGRRSPGAARRTPLPADAPPGPPPQALQPLPRTTPPRSLPRQLLPPRYRPAGRGNR
jgi:hypothetical protein